MNIKQFIIEFTRFSRPHTIIGTTISVTVLFLIAAFITTTSPLPISLLVFSIMACLGANIYIVGLNQITDIAIDKINKPYLPLASGAFSIKTGYFLIISGFIISLVLAWIYGKYLLLTVVISLALGTAYSLPPFRLKRFHFWAAFCIIAIRGLIVNIFLYLHFQFEMTSIVTIPIAIIILTIAMFGYSLIIAWFKDIPDMEGDAAHNIHTMSIRIGAAKVLLIGNLLLSFIILSLAVISFIYSTGLNAMVMAIVHLVMLVLLWYRSSQVDAEVHEDIRKYYLFIWTLFFLEYITFAIAAWGN